MLYVSLYRPVTEVFASTTRKTRVCVCAFFCVADYAISQNTCDIRCNPFCWMYKSFDIHLNRLILLRLCCFGFVTGVLPNLFQSKAHFIKFSQRAASRTLTCTCSMEGASSIMACKKGLQRKRDANKVCVPVKKLDSS
jgi:hypothetical protein